MVMMLRRQTTTMPVTASVLAHLLPAGDSP
jgi:hypothetical protein